MDEFLVTGKRPLFFSSVMQPALYHGAHLRPLFFEGWYFKGDVDRLE